MTDALSGLWNQNSKPATFALPMISELAVKTRRLDKMSRGTGKSLGLLLATLALALASGCNQAPECSNRLFSRLDLENGPAIDAGTTQLVLNFEAATPALPDGGALPMLFYADGVPTAEREIKSSGTLLWSTTADGGSFAKSWALADAGRFELVLQSPVGSLLVSRPGADKPFSEATVGVVFPDRRLYGGGCGLTGSAESYLLLMNFLPGEGDAGVRLGWTERQLAGPL